jgi:HAD superfamily hydrolase (TIGR01490 family)
LSRALAVFDLDGTITRSDTLGPYLLGFVRRRPWRMLRAPAAVPAVFAFVATRDRGRVKGAAIHALLGGSAREPIESWSQQFVHELLPSGLYVEALEAIDRHRARGDRLLLMSASTDLYVPRIGAALGFEEVVCSRVRWRADGRLDGRLEGANCRGKEKRRQLAAIIERDRPERVYAYGNSGSDLAHMALAHEAFLINAPAHLSRDPGGRLRSLHWQQRPSTSRS